MAKYNVGFNRKLTAAMNDKMIAAWEQLGAMKACAGIRNNPEAARLARMNHHGAPSTKVPARPFINSTSNLEGANFGTNIRKVIKDALRTPKIRSSAKGVNMRRDRPFGSVDLGDETRTSIIQRTPNRIMNKIAQTIAQNQRNAILGRKFGPGPVNGNNPKRNADSVIYRKGKDSPLIDSGDMLNSIEGWVE